VLSLWYYFWDAAAWSNIVTGTGVCSQAGQQCSGTGLVENPVEVPVGGGWQEYSHVLSLNRPHWSAPRPKKIPVLPTPVPVEEPKYPTIIGYGNLVQPPGQVVGWGENIDVELELIAAIMAAACFDDDIKYTLEITVQPQRKEESAA
jgi:hypothetical protein